MAREDRMQVRFTPETYDAYTALARLYGMKRAELVRWALRYFIGGTTPITRNEAQAALAQIDALAAQGTDNGA